MKDHMEKRPLALYVHIPFCVKKCAYCDFLSAPASEKAKENYVNLLCEEIEREAVCYPDYRGTTVFFGGGTPTVLRPEQLEKILCKLKNCFSMNQSGLGQKRSMLSGEKAAGEPEITLECNPGTVTEEDLQKLRETGFNRLSIGLQSAQNAELKKLGRIHSWEEFLNTYDSAGKAGFRNINVDLMSALPGQTVESYVNTLEKVTALRPEHISAYSLIIEEGTPFYERYGEADAQRRRDGEDESHLLPTEEEERRMYELTQEILGEKGYHRYEISNYALSGCECRHNITYWRRGDYLGLGLGAASLVENCRFTKTRDLEEYRELLQDDGMTGTDHRDREDRANRSGRDTGESRHGILLRQEKKNCGPNSPLHRNLQKLSIQEQMEEFMFLGLRLTEGISCPAFQEYFQTPIEDIYGAVLRRLEKEGLLVRREDKISLTKRGIDVSNVVLSEFLL